MSVLVVDIVIMSLFGLWSSDVVVARVVRVVVIVVDVPLVNGCLFVLLPGS